MNVLHSNINSIISCELNLNTGIRSTFDVNTVKTLFSLNVEKLQFTNNGIQHYIFNTHQPETLNTFNDKVSFLPVTSIFEKKETLLNLENKIQKVSKVLNAPTNNIKNVEDIVEAILLLNKEKTSKIADSFNFINKNSISNRLSATYLNSFDSIINNFYKTKEFTKMLINNDNKFISTFDYKLNTFNNENLYQKIYMTSFKNLIPNFYMTDTISKHSSMMSMCSLFNISKNNFYTTIN
jgi:NADH dehydrogenase/NADH:ubiquinone oxidoreductase subunit G